MAWVDVAWGKVIFVIRVYYVYPGIFLIPHSTVFVD